MAKEAVTRNPLRIAGAAPGRMMARMMVPVDRPKLCPMRIRLRGTLSTPPIVATTVGKNTPRAIVTILEPSPMPNQMMNSGTRAIFGIGNSAATTAMTGERVTDHKPAAMPVATPKIVPATQPISRRDSDAERCFHNAPDKVSCHSVSAIDIGDDRNNVEMAPAQTPSCQPVRMTSSVAAPASQRSRGANPPPRKAIGPLNNRIDAFSFGDRRVVANDAPQRALQREQIRIFGGTSGQRPLDVENFPHATWPAR